MLAIGSATLTPAQAASNLSGLVSANPVNYTPQVHLADDALGTHKIMTMVRIGGTIFAGANERDDGVDDVDGLEQAVDDVGATTGLRQAEFAAPRWRLERRLVKP